MRLLSCEQTAHYHIKQADICLMNGDTRSAKLHLRAAYYAMNNDRENYLGLIGWSHIARYDSRWKAQRNLEAA